MALIESCHVFWRSHTWFLSIKVRISSRRPPYGNTSTALRLRIQNNRKNTNFHLSSLFLFFFFLLQPHFYTQVSEVPKAIKKLLKHTTPVLIEIVSVISMCIQITVVLYFRPILVLFGFFAVIAFFKIFSTMRYVICNTIVSCQSMTTL